MEGPEENNNPREFIAENVQAVLDDIFVSSSADSEETKPGFYIYKQKA